MGSFCSDSQQQNSKYGWQDPLGPTSMSKSGSPTFSATGAPQMRSNIYDYLGGYLPQMTQSGQDLASSLKSAAGDSGWTQAQDLAKSNMAGDYLAGSPQLTAGLDANTARAEAGAADQNARTRSDFTRNGMAFSTGNEQAQQANMAAAEAAAKASNDQAYLANYQAERTNQNNAGSELATAQQAPLSYLSSVPGAYTAPLSSAGNLLTGLSSGGGVYNTSTSGTYTPSTFSSIVNGMGAMSSSI